jgi:hypothetical protein
LRFQVVFGHELNSTVTARNYDPENSASTHHWQQQMISVGMMAALVFAPLVLGIVALGVAADKFASLSSLTSRCRDLGWSRFDFLLGTRLCTMCPTARL